MYKGKYLIGVYSTIKEGETLLALCDNAREFAKVLDTTLESASAILSKIWNNTTKYIIYNNKVRYVEFILAEDE